jgi:hypothetical protein
MNKVAQYFVATGHKCSHCTNNTGECECKECKQFVRDHGDALELVWNVCADCLGTRNELMRRPKFMKPCNDGHVVGERKFRPKERSKPNKPLRGSTVEDDSKIKPRRPPNSEPTTGGMMALIAKKKKGN